MVVGGTVKPPASSASLIRCASSNSASGLPAGLRDEPVSDPSVQMPRHGRAEQGAGVLVSQPFHGQRRQTSEHRFVGLLPDREQEHHRLGQQPSADEAQDLGGGFIQPLSVIDEADQGPLGRHLRQQAQHRKTDQEPVRSAPCGQPEGDLQRVPLGPRQRGQATEHRRAELVQRRERQLHLGFHAGDPNEATARRLARAVAQQCRLADPRLAPEDQRFALAASGTLQHAVEGLALA